MASKNTLPNRTRKRERKPGVFTDRYIKSLKPDTEMYLTRRCIKFVRGVVLRSEFCLPELKPGTTSIILAANADK